MKILQCQMVEIEFLPTDDEGFIKKGESVADLIDQLTFEDDNTENLDDYVVSKKTMYFDSITSITESLQFKGLGVIKVNEEHIYQTPYSYEDLKQSFVFTRGIIDEDPENYFSTYYEKMKKAIDN